VESATDPYSRILGFLDRSHKILCFFIYIYRPPLWSSGQSSWLQIWRPGSAITLPTSGGRSVGIVRSRTQTMEFMYYIYIYIYTLVPLKTFTLHFYFWV
jgi:hypothetical protein